jgi:hypothetical protein
MTPAENESIPTPSDEMVFRNENRLRADAPSQVAATEKISESFVVEMIETEELIDELKIAQQERYIVAKETDVFEDQAVVMREETMDKRKRVVTSRARNDTFEKAKLSAPEPEIGMEAYEKYLKDAKLPLKDEECSKINEVVEVEFTIIGGKPVDFVIKQTVCDAADKEAIRLIENGCKWIGEDGKKVVLKVSF